MAGSDVRLADFIAQNLEPILSEWVIFARTCVPAALTMDEEALRDHGSAMLQDIVADLRTAQSPAEQSSKSKGHGSPDGSQPDTSAESHGAGRAESGFTLSQMVAEYRALRASVLRLWTATSGTLTGTDITDLMRFNEAIDQSLAESTARHVEALDRSRETFIAILGHDLRNPLNTVMVAAEAMRLTNELSDTNVAMTERIISSAQHMALIARDLLDFARGHLGAGIPVQRTSMDLAEEVALAIGDMRLAHPSRPIRLESTGAQRGQWDGARLRQLLSNLLSNAVQHGAPNSEIRVTMCGTDDSVMLAVQNVGPTIPSAQLTTLFYPFKRPVYPDAASRHSEGLGLGLYIVAQIVYATGGTIEVASTLTEGTIFTVMLPRDEVRIPEATRHMV